MEEESIVPQSQVHLFVVIPVIVLATLFAFAWGSRKSREPVRGSRTKTIFRSSSPYMGRTVRRGPVRTTPLPLPVMEKTWKKPTDKEKAAIRESQELCVECHLAEDEPEKEFEDGKEILIGLDFEKYKASPHGSILACGACHKGPKGKTYDEMFDEEGEHEYFEGSYAAFQQNVFKACADCHSSAKKAMDASSHGPKSKLTCVKCHGFHEIKGQSLKPKEVAGYCGECHKDSLKAMAPKADVHAAALDRGTPNAATCIDCHGGRSAHKVTNDEDLIDRNCKLCHRPVQMQFKDSGHADDINCIGCHTGHEMKTGALAPQKVAEYCGECHSDQAEIHTPKTDVHAAALARGRRGSPTCIDCHGRGSSHRVTKNAQILDRTCGQCHGETERDLLQSAHGRQANLTCVKCHGSHKVRRIRLAPQEVAKYCSVCHNKLEGSVTQNYKMNVHETAVQKGVKGAPTCIDCHGSTHTVMTVTPPKKDPKAEPAKEDEEPKPETKLPWGLIFRREQCLECHLKIDKELLPKHAFAFPPELHLSSELGCACHTESSGPDHILGANQPVSGKARGEICALCHTAEGALHKAVSTYKVLVPATAEQKRQTGSTHVVAEKKRYIIGATRHDWIDYVGIFLVVSTFLAMPLGHGTLRFLAGMMLKKKSE